MVTAALLGSRESQEWRQFLTDTPPDPIRDLIAYLKGEWSQGEPDKLTSREPDATGCQLTDTMWNRLEIAQAWPRLTYRQRRIIELEYRDKEKTTSIMRILCISQSTLHRERRQALETLKHHIYDWKARNS